MPLLRSLDPMRLISWASGASMSSELPISDPDPDPGLLGPDSLTWHLHEEEWLIGAGARAFLLQAAHPKVAQGALDHSGFAHDPFGRVHRTILAMAVLLFGTTREASAMARHINRLHQSVQGTLSSSVGRYRAGDAYSAMDQSALLWVHAAFVDSVLTAYRCFVGPLSEATCDQYWQESCRYARLLGVSAPTLPTSYAALQAYLRQAHASGEIAIGEEAHFIARKILSPSIPWLRRPLWMLVWLITVGQLPPAIRRDYGLCWTPGHEAIFRMACRGARLLRRVFPHLLGRSSLVDFANRRVRGELSQSSLATVEAFSPAHTRGDQSRTLPPS
jgi:uncharacterized protein (DUF2236 family)